MSVSAVAGGIVGYIVTDASCGPDSCSVAASITAVIVGLVIAAGVGVVAVLALKSIDEHRVHRERLVLTEIESRDEDDDSGGPEHERHVVSPESE